MDTNSTVDSSTQLGSCALLDSFEEEALMIASGLTFNIILVSTNLSRKVVANFNN